MAFDNMFLNGVILTHNEERDSWVIFVDGEWYYESSDYGKALKVLYEFGGECNG